MLIFSKVTLAQTEPGLTLNENRMGEITLTASSQLYRFTNDLNEIPLIIQVSSLSQDFAPVLVLYDAQERRLARASNPSGLVQRQLGFTPQPNTDYLIQILGVDGSQGEFVLTITQQPYTTAAPYAELRPNYDFEDAVTLDTPFKIYQVTATESLILDITSAGSAVVISDADGNIYGTASQALPNSSFTLPPARNAVYYVTIYHSGIDRREPFTIRLFPTLSE